MEAEEDMEAMEVMEAMEAMEAIEEEEAWADMVAVAADLGVIMAAPTVEVAGGHMDTPTVGHMAGPSITQSIVTGIDMA